MSVYGSFCIFDGDEPNMPAPLVYRRSHVLPSLGDERGGSFDLASIPAWITRDGWCLSGKTCAGDSPCRCEDGERSYWPFLRMSLRSPTPGEDTCVLDRAQVAVLRDALTDWLDHTREAP